MKSAVSKKAIMPSDPIVVPEHSNGPIPFLTRFIEKPEVMASAKTTVNANTYMGVTAGTSAGTEGDYENDD